MDETETRRAAADLARMLRTLARSRSDLLRVLDVLTRTELPAAYVRERRAEGVTALLAIDDLAAALTIERAQDAARARPISLGRRRG